jgi:hypothetical protein
LLQLAQYCPVKFKFLKSKMLEVAKFYKE